MFQINKYIARVALLHESNLCVNRECRSSTLDFNGWLALVVKAVFVFEWNQIRLKNKQNDSCIFRVNH